MSLADCDTMDDVEGGVSGRAFAVLGVFDGGGENGD
jgi:hypothetical protein